MEESKKMTFKDYYKSLILKEKKRIRVEFMAGSGISYPGFNTKIARGNFTLLEKELMKRICDFEFDQNESS